MKLPEQMGTFHIVGIGGIGMSAIAEVLVGRGYHVQGSDRANSANVQRLRHAGVRVFVGHDPINLIGAQTVVVSSAVKPGNPEYDAARAKGLPIISRAEILSEIMRGRKTVSITGTHGKTTTTSIVSHLFEKAETDPTVISGGIINDWNSNARYGQGDWMVVEADESDGTFVRLPTQVGVVTNMDPEHLDYYGTVEKMNGAYQSFFCKIPFYGLGVACIDHPVVRTVVERMRESGNARRLVTYGASSDADVRLTALKTGPRGIEFDVEMNEKAPGGARTLSGLTLPLPGHYNALNSLAAIVCSSEAGISDAVIRDGLASFGGVQRRFTRTGEWNGVTFFDDYAHHPVEIKSVLRAARQTSEGRVIAIMEPHRYTRLQSLFSDFCNCFGDADAVMLMPVYTAGELPIDGVDHVSLAEGVRTSGHSAVIALGRDVEVVDKVRSLAKPGDLVIGVGAGLITKWMHDLPSYLANGDDTSDMSQAGSGTSGLPAMKSAGGAL